LFTSFFIGEQAQRSGYTASQDDAGHPWLANLDLETEGVFGSPLASISIGSAANVYNLHPKIILITKIKKYVYIILILLSEHDPR
jgi:hypothetical protein